MKKQNFNTRRGRVNLKLLTSAEAILGNWLEGEIQGEEFVALNPLRNDTSTGSFSVNIKTGLWKDFAMKDFAGPDLVSLYIALNDLDEDSALCSGQLIPDTFLRSFS